MNNFFSQEYKKLSIKFIKVSLREQVLILFCGMAVVILIMYNFLLEPILDNSKKLKQITSLFTSFRDAYEPRPFNILKENTLAYGFRSRFLGTAKLFETPLNYTFGGEYFRDCYSFSTFQNLYQDFEH